MYIKKKVMFTRAVMVLVKIKVGRTLIGDNPGKSTPSKSGNGDL